MNPRAPLDLLVDAVGESTGRDSSESLESAVVGMKALATALAADPKAAVSASGLAFYAERAAALASSAATAVTKGDDAATVSKAVAAEAAGAAAEACGLMLRILQVAGLAVNSTASAGGRTEGQQQADGGEGGEEEQSAVTDVHPADRLLLPCSPEASSSLPTDVVAAATAAAGAPPTTKVPPPPARLSVSRLLAHYAVTSAVCCSAGRGKGPGTGAAAFIRGARATAAGKAGGGGADSGNSSSSDDDDEDEDTYGAPGYGSSRTLSQHLSALCAASLAGNEPATLEFLRCVGDAVCAVAAAPERPAATANNLGRGGSGDAVRASLAPTCSRALARLPRPAASPPPTAAQFVKRAYAFRVVDALNRSAAAAAQATAVSSSSSLSGKKGAVTAFSGRAATALSSGGGRSSAVSASRAPSWDFVGAGAVSPALLEFLERPEAPAAVGKGPAGAAVEELVAALGRHGRRSPAGVAELLRSSPACSPFALSALLSAMERLEGGGDTGDDGDGAGGTAAAPAMGGFFLDTGGASGAAAGAGAGTVLARLGSGDGVGVEDMDQVEVASAVSSALSDSGDEA